MSHTLPRTSDDPVGTPSTSPGSYVLEVRLCQGRVLGPHEQGRERREGEGNVGDLGSRTFLTEWVTTILIHKSTFIPPPP